MSETSFEDSSVLSFTTLPEFLSDHYKKEKLKKRNFSFEIWGRSIRGMNRSYLRQISAGRRPVPEEFIEPLQDYFSFKDAAKDHLGDLIELTRIRSERQRTPVAERVAQRKKYHQSLQFLKDASSFLEDQRISLLATLLGFSDLKRTTANLAALLNQDEATISKWLQVLENLNLASSRTEENRCGETSWFATSESFRVPENLGSEALISYHRQVLKTALRACQNESSSPSKERRFESMYFALDQAELEELIARLNRFRLEVLSAHNRDTFSGRKLYQLNFALVPVVKGLA